LNALLPARIDLGALVFEYSNRDFFEPQNDAEACWFHASVCSIRGFFETQNVNGLERSGRKQDCCCLALVLM
jgi:hypothetical protein